MTATVFSDTVCELGEGPLWHPEREQLFWVDILGKRLLTRTDKGEQSWSFDAHPSALAWLDRDRLMIATETAILDFEIASGEARPVCPLEAENAATRSNDGRADPWGGFWIGTMGKRAEPGAGAIYRYREGALRRLVDGVTIPNAICFAPDGACAYFTDTADGRVLRQTLDDEGWPEGSPEVLIDARGAGWGPDGAVTDAEGCLWLARFGGGAVARHAPDGALVSLHEVPTPQPTCPAFGGPGLGTLHVTSAAEGGHPRPAGCTFALAPGLTGWPEPRVRL